MTREDQVEKILDELEEEFAKANMPVNDKLTLFAKVSNAIYKYAEREPCTDAISRQAAIDACLNGWNKDYKEIVEEIRALPPVKPQYTDTEIQKMQDLEFAEIQKAYEIGKAEGSEVLDKIRAEIDSYCSDNRDRNDGLYIAMRIIDKYKASPTGEEAKE